MEYREKKEKKNKDERDQKETGGSPLCLIDRRQVKQRRQFMCVWERFPGVSRDADLLGILGIEGFTFSYLDVYSKSGWGAVSHIQLTAASHPECLQRCSYLSGAEITWEKSSSLPAFESYYCQ